MYIHEYIYIYIYRERERDLDRWKDRLGQEDPRSAARGEPHGGAPGAPRRARASEAD